jgi:hypothetical protein
MLCPEETRVMPPMNVGQMLQSVSVIATAGAQVQPNPDQQAQAWRDILQGGFGVLVVLGIGVFALVKLLKAGKKPS